MMERLKESKWVYVLISVVLALTFWLYVRTVQDPQDSSWIYNVPVQVTGSTVLTRQGLTVAELSAETVNLRVEGPTSTLDDLLKYRKEILMKKTGSMWQRKQKNLFRDCLLWDGF